MATWWGVVAIMLWWRPRNRILTFPRFLLATAILLAPAIAVDVLLLPDVVVFTVSIWVTGSVAVLTAAGVWWDARRTAQRRTESVAD